MHFYVLTGLVPVLLTLSGAAWAAPVVTETELLSRLDGDFPAVISRSAQLPLARAELLDARVLENPVIEIGREDPRGAVAQTEWLLSWQLPEPNRRLKIAAAEKAVDAASARVEDQLRSLRASVREDYARWAIASTRSELLGVEADRLGALAERERARTTQGEASGLEARRLGLAAATLRAHLSLASTEERQARSAINRWFPDLSSDAKPELPKLPDPSGAPPASLAGEVPLVVATQAEAEAAGLAQRASERFFASPELTVGWQREEAFAGEEAGPVIGFTWSVPLFDRNQAERRASQARVEAARAEAEMATREIAARSEVARSRYADLVLEVAVAKAVLESSADMLHAAETSFRYGELTLTDLLEIQRSVTDAQLAWLALYDNALAAHREIEALSGTSSLSFDPNPLKNTSSR